MNEMNSETIFLLVAFGSGLIFLIDLFTKDE